MTAALKASPLAAQGLRERISSLPADRQLVLRDTWPEDLPSLLDPALTAEQLDTIRRLVDNIANPPPPAPADAIPAERIAELRAAVNSLPEDLVLQLSAAASSSGVPPQMKGATVEHEQLVVRLLDAMTAEQTARRAHVHGRMAAFDNDETIRHALIRFATAGRVESSQQVTAEEVTLVDKAADLLELGDLELIIAGDGATSIGDPAGKWAPSMNVETDWKQVAKDQNTTQAALLRRARQLAIEAGEEAPSKLQQITPTLLARLLTPTDAQPPKAETAPVAAEPVVVVPEPPTQATPPPVTEPAAAAAGVLVVLVRPGGLQQHLVDDETAARIVALVGAA